MHSPFGYQMNEKQDEIAGQAAEQNGKSECGEKFMSKEILKLKDITKVYDNGIVANKKIDLEIRENEIHAIVGENGQGNQPS